MEDNGVMVVNPDYPGNEFKQIGLFFGNIMTVFRVAMGDYFFISQSTVLDGNDNIQFWVIFFLILIMNNIIFLNFVIAEAGNSYNKVNDHI